MPLRGRVEWRVLPPAGWVLAWAVWRLRAEGRHRVPRGPLVIASNHYSHIDPPLVGLVVGRPVRFLAVDELFGLYRFLDWVMLGFGAIPLSRDGVPLRAMRLALLHLAAGGAVGVFPEGRRVAAWGETEPKRGAAWLAHRSGAALLPVALSGTDAVYGIGAARVRFSKLRVTIAEPLYPADFAASPDPVRAMTDAWRQAIDAELRRGNGRVVRPTG